MKTVKVVKTEYAGLQVFYMAEVCMISGFAVLFLSNRGLNNTSAGAAVALARLLSIFALNPISRKLDSNKALLKKLFPIAAFLMLLMHTVLAFTSFSVLMTFIVFVATSLLSALCSSLSVVLYSDLTFCGHRINYGLSRGLGSFSYTVVSFFSGRLVAAYRPECITIIGIAASFGFLITTVLICADLSPDRTNSVISTKADKNLFSYIRGREGFSFLFIGIILIYTAYISANSFAINLIQYIGGSANELGIYNAIGALFEIPFMIVFSKISVRNNRQLLRISLLLMTLKVLVLAMSRNMYWVCAAALLQGASFGLYTPAIVNYVRSITSYDNSAKGQSATLIASSLGGVFGMLISGRLLDVLAVRQVLLIMTIVSAAGSVTVWRASMAISNETNNC